MNLPLRMDERMPQPRYSQNIRCKILDSIANVKNEQELCDIKNLIAEYFSNKALDAMDKLCEDGTLSTETIQSWQSEHMRTPY